MSWHQLPSSPSAPPVNPQDNTPPLSPTQAKTGPSRPPTEDGANQVASSRSSSAPAAPRQPSLNPSAAQHRQPAPKLNLEQASAIYKKMCNDFKQLNSEYLNATRRLDDLANAGAITKEVAHPLENNMKEGLKNLNQGLQFMYTSLNDANSAASHLKPEDQGMQKTLDTQMEYLNQISLQMDQNTIKLRRHLASASTLAEVGELFFEHHQKVQQTQTEMRGLVDSATSSGLVTAGDLSHASGLLKQLDDLNQVVGQAKNALNQGNSASANKILKEAQFSFETATKDADSLKIFLSRKTAEGLIHSNQELFTPIEQKLKDMVGQGKIEASVLTDIKVAMRLSGIQSESARDHYKGNDEKGIKRDHEAARLQAGIAVISARQAENLLMAAKQQIESIESKPKKKGVQFAETRPEVFVIETENTLSREDAPKGHREKKSKELSEQDVLKRIEGRRNTPEKEMNPNIMKYAMARYTELVDEKNNKRVAEGKLKDSSYDEDLSKQAENETLAIFNRKNEAEQVNENLKTNMGQLKINLTNEKLPW